MMLLKLKSLAPQAALGIPDCSQAALDEPDQRKLQFLGG